MPKSALGVYVGRRTKDTYVYYLHARMIQV